MNILCSAQRSSFHLHRAEFSNDFVCFVKVHDRLLFSKFMISELMGFVKWGVIKGVTVKAPTLCNAPLLLSLDFTRLENWI